MTKEEMLRLLTAAYTGPGSAAEGTFAGDVFQCLRRRNGAALEHGDRRTGTAGLCVLRCGEWLTAVCADRGCVRKEGETDEELRARTLAALAATPASGNAEHYAAWCGQAADILRVKVLPLARGNGTVDIVAVGREGKAPSEAAIREAQAVVDRERPVGAGREGHCRR
ncbi:MAG: baseplate J/gp47 family protein [Dysosmobacter sp.]